MDSCKFPFELTQWGCSASRWVFSQQHHLTKRRTLEEGHTNVTCLSCQHGPSLGSLGRYFEKVISMNLTQTLSNAPMISQCFPRAKPCWPSGLSDHLPGSGKISCRHRRRCVAMVSSTSQLSISVKEEDHIYPSPRYWDDNGTGVIDIMFCSCFEQLPIFTGSSMSYIPSLSPFIVAYLRQNCWHRFWPIFPLEPNDK